jgi:Aldehyde dehydrogenase family
VTKAIIALLRALGAGQVSAQTGSVDDFAKAEGDAFAVNGNGIETGRTYANVDPVNGAKVCDASEADQATVDQAVGAARATTKGEWGYGAAADRPALVHKVADRIEVRLDKFIEPEIAETGYIYPHARSIDIPRDAANIRIFADLIKANPNEAYEPATPNEMASLVCWLTSQECSLSTRPVGSSAGITTGIDLALALIGEDFSHERESDRFAKLERWIAENLKADLRIESLAERAHMSPRNFARVYTQKNAAGLPQRRWKRFDLMRPGDVSKRLTTASKPSPRSVATAVKIRCVGRSCAS